MKISILIATCFRPQMFSAMLDSLEATTAGYDLEVIAVIDKDEESRAIAEARCDVVDYSEEMRGALYCWNRGLELSTGPYIVPAGDDQVFYPNWLDYALESHRERLGGYGVVGMNDLAYDGNKQLATMFLFDRKYCQEVMGGVIAPPCYEYLCVDSEWNAKAKLLGRFYWNEQAIVEHLHSAHGKREYDEHDRWKDEQNLSHTDGKVYADRLSNGFPIQWDSLI